MTLNKKESGDVEASESLSSNDDFVSVSPVPSVMSLPSDCSSSSSLSSNEICDVAADLLIEAKMVEQDQLIEDEAQGAQRRVGAGIAVGVITLPVLGFVAATVAGVAASFGATQPGATGDVCRACGDVALNARAKAMEVDKKHELSKKAKTGASTALKAVQDTNEKYGILERVQKGLKEAWKKLNDFEKEHQVFERTIQGVSSIFKKAADTVKKAKEQSRKEPADGEKDLS